MPRPRVDTAEAPGRSASGGKPPHLDGACHSAPGPFSRRAGAIARETSVSGVAVLAVVTSLIRSLAYGRRRSGRRSAFLLAPLLHRPGDRVLWNGRRLGGLLCRL